MVASVPELTNRTSSRLGSSCRSSSAISISCSVGAPKDSPWRLIPAVEIAKVVWDAYHADKVHWYVPTELYDFDTRATADPETMRDEMAAGRELGFLE